MLQKYLDMQVIDIDNSYPMTKKERAEKRHNLAKGRLWHSKIL
jgi:hypothetical protein